MEGLSAEVALVVAARDTAVAYGSGDVPVLATPRVLALAEQAAVEAIAGHLAAGKTSVGIHAELHHVKATAVGQQVVARAEVASVSESGKSLSYDIVITESDESVAFGTHRRVIVDRKRFG